MGIIMDNQREADRIVAEVEPEVSEWLAKSLDLCKRWHDELDGYYPSLVACCYDCLISEYNAYAHDINVSEEIFYEIAIRFIHKHGA